MELNKLNKELQKKDQPKKEEPRLDEAITLLTVCLASFGFVFLMRAIMDVIKNRKHLSPSAVIQKWNEIAALKARSKEIRKETDALDVQIAKEKEKSIAMKKESELLAKILPKLDDPEVIRAGRDYLAIAQNYISNTKDAEKLLEKSQAFGRLRDTLADKMTPSEIDALSDLIDRKAREDKALMN